MDTSSKLEDFGPSLFSEPWVLPAWRQQDREQCHLQNARQLWEYNLDRNQQALEEHAEYVRAMAALAAFMAGFVNIAFVQFGFDTQTISYPVLMGFAITNALTTGLSTCCMTICILILSGTFRISAALLSQEEEAHFLFACRQYALGDAGEGRPPAPPRSFRSNWSFLCQSEWHRALAMFSLAIVCFTANTAFAAFIKFHEFKAAAIVLASALGMGVAFCLYFHLRWVPGLIESKVLSTPQEVTMQPGGMPFDWYLPGTKFQKMHSLTSSQSPAITAPTSWDELPRARQDLLRQRLINNALYLWKQYVRRSDHSLEERVEQLKSFSFLSGVVAGFAVAALLQLDFDVATTPDGFQLWFALTAGLTAACATMSMAMCSLMLMSTIRVSRGLVSDEEETQFLARCLHFAQNYKPGMRPPYPQRSFENHWQARCEGEWTRAFYLFTAGLFAFVVNVMAGAWIKYSPFSHVSVAATVIMSVALLYLIQLHLRWASYLTSRSPSSTDALKVSLADFEPAGLPFDWHLPPVAARTHSVGI